MLSRQSSKQTVTESGSRTSICQGVWQARETITRTCPNRNAVSTMPGLLELSFADAALRTMELIYAKSRTLNFRFLLHVLQVVIIDDASVQLDLRA